MKKLKNKWFVIILIYLLPLFLDHVETTDELIWLIYIFPSVWLPFYFGMRGGIIAAFTGIVIHAINEVYRFSFKHEIYQMNEIWCMAVITLVNITVALTIGKLVDKLRLEQDSLQKVIAKMEYMAYHDYLTGLPNRWNFEIKLKSALDTAKKSNQLLAVLFLDLDRFKLINDSLGHSIGDRLLKDVSKRIQANLKDEDCIARQGGDEFILFFTGFSSTDEVEEIVISLHQAIQSPFKIYDKEYFISSSIGISLFPSNGLGWEELIQQADIAMYTAKEMGGNGFQWYNSAKQQEIHDVVKIETHLRKALKQNEFKLHFQPLVNLKNGKIFGFEALLRWYNTELGFISPADFIPLTEEIGMIIPIGEWVLREACFKMKTLSKVCEEPMKVAVNISSKQFQDDNFIEIVQRVLEETSLPPSQLELEITESVSLDNIDRVIMKLHSLREMGISISIDDFGTGYSSISYLKYLPVNTLKIDKSFVQNMLTNMKDRALVESVISLAKSFGFNIIAEGVESDEQLTLLKTLECPSAQGFLFSKPVPMKEVYLLFEENKKQAELVEYVS
jgi:diguanylate cyclase (GGDEF)-like protein